MIRSQSGNSLAGVVLAVLALGFLVCIPSYSQVVGGTISGTVFDTSEVVISGAELSFMNAATGVNTIVTTNGKGIYNAPNLLPGTYTVSISAAGFQTNVAAGITLDV